MIWPWNRGKRTSLPEEIVRAQQASDRQLVEARHLRTQAQAVGSSLSDGKDANHYAMALAAVFSKGPNR